MIEIIRQGQPISGVSEETADKILAMLHEQETGKLCKLIGIPRAGVLRAWRWPWRWPWRWLTGRPR